MMTENEFCRLTEGQGYTLAQIALLRKLYDLPYNKRDLPKDQDDGLREFGQAIERFNQARRMKHEREA